MKQFRLVDNIVGWLVFAVAAVVYVSTIEPTASFWDCPEFITTAYKLEVGHPPGAPFFAITANIFTQFVSDPAEVARMVNTMSALLSAATILFLFWSITHLTRRLLTKEWADLSLGKLIAIEASGIVGALIYTFSDTFWFSAVEGEVYAYSSAFTAVVFWLILKWEDHADEPHSDRWLVLIMYMTGLSIGVHLLNLLCIPAIVLVYYYRRFPHDDPKKDLRGSIAALIISAVIIVAVLYGVVPGIVAVGGWFELFFVNTLGCPFNTGEIVYIVLLVACIIWAIRETYKSDNPKRSNLSYLASVAMLGIPFYGHGWTSIAIGLFVLIALWLLLNRRVKGQYVVSQRVKNTSLLCMLMLMIGYSSYALIVIRSSANPPMDQNSPEDIFTLGDYLGREQYGDRPLFYGQAYTSQVALDKDGEYCRPQMTKGAPVYQRKEKATNDEKDSYYVVRTRDSYKYAQNMLFPRMYSDAHAAAYESWMGGVDGSDVAYDRCGETVMVKMPSQLENIRFFLSYQCNFMYWRYFMWNFAGRQNDLQGNGELEHGNWLTGFDFIDNARLGDQSRLPDDLKANKGHNVFYCLPLLLGLLGLFWQSMRRGQTGIRQFWVVFFLFFMTGLAIVLYLNQTPMQPRERDYAYAGSFYAFTIWCGMGVAAIIDEINRKLRGRVPEAAVATVVGLVCLAVPIQMASQTWDDHDRSGRYTCRDFGRNYLNTLPEKGNPIIFTNGDNDTFPLWYNQEVEGVRTDARVCNLCYVQTDWYIDQMTRPAYDSPAAPITWKRIEYQAGTNEYVSVAPEMKGTIAELYKQYPDEAKAALGDKPFELSNVLDLWVRGKATPEQKEVMKLITGGSDPHVIPTDTVFITIDKEAVRRSGMLMAADSIPDKMVISLKGKRALYKGDLMMLEMIAHANWTRPIYVATTVGSDNYMNLGDNFVSEGLANRITPFTTNAPGAKNLDIERTYDNLMHRYRFGGLETPGLYIDETVMRMCYTHRRLFATLAMHLAANHDDKRALEVLAYAEKHIPEYNVPHDYNSGSFDAARVYAVTGKTAKARHILEALWKKSEQYLNWYVSLTGSRFSGAERDAAFHFYIAGQVVSIMQDIDSKASQKMFQRLSQLDAIYEGKGGRLME